MNCPVNHSVPKLMRSFQHTSTRWNTSAICADQTFSTLCNLGTNEYVFVSAFMFLLKLCLFMYIYVYAYYVWARTSTNIALLKTKYIYYELTSVNIKSTMRMWCLSHSHSGMQDENPLGSKVQVVFSVFYGSLCVCVWTHCAFHHASKIRCGAEPNAWCKWESPGGRFSGI